MLRRWLDRLYLAAGALAAVCIALIAALMIGQSVLREFGVRTGAVNDVVSWLCAASAFLNTSTTPASRSRPNTRRVTCMKIAILLIHELLLVDESLIPPSAKTLRFCGSSRSRRVCSLSTSYIFLSAGVPKTCSSFCFCHPVFTK